MMEGRLWQVTAPHYVAGLIEAQDGVIINAAPIIKWAAGNNIRWFKWWCAKKGYRLEVVE